MAMLTGLPLASLPEGRGGGVMGAVAAELPKSPLLVSAALGLALAFLLLWLFSMKDGTKLPFSLGESVVTGVAWKLHVLNDET